MIVEDQFVVTALKCLIRDRVLEAKKAAAETSEERRQLEEETQFNNDLMAILISAHRREYPEVWQ